MPKQNSQKSVLKSVRRKLHNIVAPYLGEPDYAAYSAKLSKIRDSSLQSNELRSFCLEILSEHASTKERIPFHSQFYSELFQEVGKPGSVVDLACGLHPFAFPWMGLPLSIEYHAYDILQPRIDFINLFFTKIGLKPLAENRDILVNPPLIRSDLGLFFKEAHRFEKRQPGCNRNFWQSLIVSNLAISLPTQDLSGTHRLIDYHRQLVLENLPEGSEVKEIEFPNEVLFILKAQRGAHAR
jgi:16S rRNA (guanine(1405)-N(7))-methyltransferase